MIVDHDSVVFHRWRNQLSIVVLPIQKVVDFPLRLSHSVFLSLTTQKSLIQENTQLRANQLLLQAEVHRLLVVERENAQLKALLSSTNKVTGKVAAAELLAVDLNPALQQIVIDKGLSDHVYDGQPVLDAYGIVGQVTDAAPNISRVLLLTDTRSAIPVQDMRNGMRAIAMGTGKREALSLLNVEASSAIAVGDLMVTSGLGLRYPMGYPVGVVTRVRVIPGERFLEVIIQPTAHFDHTEQVLLAWPDYAKQGEAVKALLQKPLPVLSS